MSDATDGWDALDMYLEENKGIYLEGATQPQRDAYDELKAEVSLQLTNKNAQPPGEYFAVQLEPHLAIRDFRRDSIAHLGGLGGFNLNSTDRSAYREAGSQLERYLVSSSFTGSNSEAAYLRRTIVDPLLKEGLSNHSDPPKLSVGDFIKKSTETPVWDLYNNRRTLTTAQNYRYF